MNLVDLLSLTVYLVCICVLTAPCGHVPDTYNDLPEHYVINISSQHIKANHSVLFSTGYSSYISNHGKSTTVHSTRVPLFLHLGSILLLACGDVHPCPGPNYKYPCGVCHKPVKVNQKGILCDLCNLWHHTKCVNMPTTEYFRLADNEEEPWECPDCSFPYKFTDSFFNTTTSDSLGNDSILSENSIPDRDIFQDFFDLRKYPRKFIISHININSVQHKFSELSILLKNKLVDCLFIAESKLNASHQSNVFKVDEYTMYRKDNPRDGGGGLLCYIRSDIPSYSVTL